MCYSKLSVEKLTLNVCQLEHCGRTATPKRVSQSHLINWTHLCFQDAMFVPQREKNVGFDEPTKPYENKAPSIQIKPPSGEAISYHFVGVGVNNL